ncbi:unnamed protein product [Penicillium salamii]|nr:unnamed protein product [Penicillium salamii]
MDFMTDLLLRYFSNLSKWVPIYNDVVYVVTRIEWYSKLVDKLLSEESIKDATALQNMRDDIFLKFTSLYQSLIFYQMKSVCFYYQKHQVFVLSRGLIELDNWSGDLQSIKDAEKDAYMDSFIYDFQSLKDQLRGFFMDRKTEDHSILFHKRLEAIRRVDPHITVQTIQIVKEKSVESLYKWIFETEEFKAFAKWEHSDAPRRLWISGQAGTGKTMLLIGAIKEIQTRGLLEVTPGEPPVIIYFFCQRTDVELSNGSAVLQSLVWMFLRQQPDLLPHVDEHFAHSGDKLIQDQNSISIWNDILVKMLRHSRRRVIVVIDDLDECEENTRKFLRDFLGTSCRTLS